ncbi:MAG: hypothetical protein IJQ62_10870 [Clostridia bacterium]|nr:hypothetical protein [Clostridia bacterium]
MDLRTVLASMKLDAIRETLLTPRQRRLMEYYVDLEWPVDEVARQMAMTPAEVRRALRRIARIGLDWQEYQKDHRQETVAVTLEKGEIGTILAALEDNRDTFYSLFDANEEADWREELGFNVKKLEILIERLKPLEE